MLKHGILGLLNYGNMTGYEIMEVFRDSLKHFWKAQTSQIYRELSTLKANGWVSVRHIEQSDKPDKNLFSITEEGRKELNDWLTDGSVAFYARSPLMMKTFFRGERPVEENIAFFRQIAAERRALREGAEQPAKSAAFYERAIADPERAMYWRMTITFGQMYDKMVNDWCEQCIRELEEYQNEHPAD